MVSRMRGSAAAKVASAPAGAEAEDARPLQVHSRRLAHRQEGLHDRVGVVGREHIGDQRRRRHADGHQPRACHRLGEVDDCGSLRLSPTPGISSTASRAPGIAGAGDVGS